MNTFVALLRAINVGGQKKIPMASLRATAATLGLANIRSYVQSGNLVFDSAQADRSLLATELETAIAQAFGFEVAVLVREPASLHSLIANNPFIQRPSVDPQRLYVTFLQRLPEPERVARLAVPEGSPDEFALAGDAIWLHCPQGAGVTKLSNAFFERKLAVLATSRNWNTVNALWAMAAGG